MYIFTGLFVSFYLKFAILKVQVEAHSVLHLLENLRAPCNGALYYVNITSMEILPKWSQLQNVCYSK